MNSKIKRVAENEGYPEKKRVIGFQTEPAEKEPEKPFVDEDDVDEDD